MSARLFFVVRDKSLVQQKDMRYHRVQIHGVEPAKTPANLKRASGGMFYVGADGHLCTEAKAAHLSSRDLAVELLAIALRRWGERYGNVRTHIENCEAPDDNQMLLARIQRDTRAARICVQVAWLDRVTSGSVPGWNDEAPAESRGDGNLQAAQGGS